ncbi:Protein IDA-LIKE 4 [Glycine max]|nr:Protein IDA-LIKE 4 [Glycine max]
MVALRSRRRKTLMLLLVLFLCILGHGHGSRTTNVFKLKPKSQHTGHFFGFLPKRIHIPFSSPSKKHNDIGLQRNYAYELVLYFSSIIDLKLSRRIIMYLPDQWCTVL